MSRMLPSLIRMLFSLTPTTCTHRASWARSSATAASTAFAWYKTRTYTHALTHQTHTHTFTHTRNGRATAATTTCSGAPGWRAPQRPWASRHTQTNKRRHRHIHTHMSTHTTTHTTTYRHSHTTVQGDGFPSIYDMVFLNEFDFRHRRVRTAFT